jgi:C4-dicarboxylate transporter DctM subunit
MSEVGIVLFSTFTVLLLLNVPIAVTLGLSSLAALLVMGTPLSLFPMIMYASTAKFTLLAIPFFILAGIIMERAGISKRLIHFANTAVGHFTGGLAMVAVLTSVFFAAISGSGPATVAALGSFLIPAMDRAGYSKGMASALLATSGSIGIIIPPSIAFVIYGVVAEVSIGRMFVAGVMPGLLMGFCLIVVSYYISAKRGYGGQKKASPKEVLKAFVDAVWGLMTPVIILGGIYGGIFTPTEAAGIAVMYGLFVGVFIYKEIKLKDLKNLLVESSVSSAVVMLIVANASLFAWLITTQGIAAQLASALVGISSNRIVILLFINVLLLIAGCFIDAVSAYYILLPILMPVVYSLGINPVAFGVIMTVNLAIGQITPPVGVNLYVACGIAKISLKEITKHLTPFLVAALVSLMLITYIPQISLWLPTVMGIK